MQTRQPLGQPIDRSLPRLFRLGQTNLSKLALSSLVLPSLIAVCMMSTSNRLMAAPPLTQTGTQDQIQDQVHQPAQATSNFDVHPEVDVELFAAEPFLANPSNIDIDHLGRVWVCEVINYRHFRNTDATPREAGDRILILEDTDGDAVADKETVFYQGRDIDSAHGICVLGNRAIVSANDSVFILTDTDGDLKADKKEVLFTGIDGVQHDHGIHAFVFGPDGKLYFNFGNSGNQIKDRDGKPIVDMAGNTVVANSKPYNQGMIFRCNLDGSDFETLAWNFRNNWEVCVDSFGTLWQSDNDDDGNRATRINYVMPFGNYGYTDQRNGSNWQTPRTGMHPEIPLRHWYQNDPGVIPNLLMTGAGSPTGICVYEGDLLPEVFRNEMIHCDAGPSIVRAYPVKKSGAGYTAEIVNILDGAEKNQWFRPSDVCVAPDGSLIIADWYDPGVGGHRMQDTERGRLFRVSQKGGSGTYQFEAAKFDTPTAAVQSLRSPNQATRYLAWEAIQKFGLDAVPALQELFADANPRMQARALWALGKLPLAKADKLAILTTALSSDNADLQVTAIRLITQLPNEIKPGEFKLAITADSLAPEVFRELLIALRQQPVAELPQIWAMIADKYETGDRWFLEALGIAAEGHWDECLEAWSGNAPEKLKTAEGRDIVWRSRGSKTPQLLAAAIADEAVGVDESARYFRAYDFFEPNQREAQLANLAFGDHGFEDAKASYVIMESASRLDANSLTEGQKDRLSQLIESSRGTKQFVDFVGKFSATEYVPDLLAMASSKADRQLAADAMGVLMDLDQQAAVHTAVVQAEPEVRDVISESLVNCGKRPAAFVLGGIAKRADLDREIRTYAIKQLGQIRSGAGDMIWWIEQGEKLDPVIQPAIAASLHSARWPEIKAKANELFPMAASKDNRPLPAMDELAKLTGDVVRGKEIFATTGTCAKCHIVNKQGVEVGPDLSEIGDKLTRVAMYESILFPSAGISHNYENWMVQTDDGQIITGILLGETESEIQLKDDKGIKHVIKTETIEEKQPQKLSLMPADLHQAISEQDLVDLVEYLMTLKKQ